MIIISGFFLMYISMNNQVNIENAVKIDYSEVPKNIPAEIFYSGQIFDSCEYDMHCVVELLSDVSRKKEKPIVMATFMELLSVYHEKQVNFRCHKIAHHLGEWVYGYTKNLEESFQYANSLSCGGGIYHGIFENYFSILKFEGTVPDQMEIKNLCNKLKSDSYSFEMAQCLHGTGHGLLPLYDFNVFNAVKRCEDFNTNLEQNSCANGVFMQNVLKYFETGEGDFDQNDMLYPCNEMISQFVPTCYIWQGAYILKQRDFEVYSSFRECEKINQEFIKYCYYGIGGELESDAGGKMELALSYCQAGNIPSYHKFCFRGMVMKTSMVYLDNGFGFCALVPDEFKEECYDGLGYWIKLRHADDEAKEKECSKIQNEQYFEVCMNPKIGGITFI